MREGPAKRRDPLTNCTECSPAACQVVKIPYLEIATLDTLDDVIADFEGFRQGHSNSTLIMEAAGHRLINRARQLRQERAA